MWTVIPLGKILRNADREALWEDAYIGIPGPIQNFQWERAEEVYMVSLATKEMINIVPGMSEASFSIEGIFPMIGDVRRALQSHAFIEKMQSEFQDHPAANNADVIALLDEREEFCLFPSGYESLYDSSDLIKEIKIKNPFFGIKEAVVRCFQKEEDEGIGDYEYFGQKGFHSSWTLQLAAIEILSLNKVSSHYLCAGDASDNILSRQSIAQGAQNALSLGLDLDELFLVMSSD